MSEMKILLEQLGKLSAPKLRVLIGSHKPLKDVKRSDIANIDISEINNLVICCFTECIIMI